MSEKITKLQRWMDLVAFLAGRHFPVPLDEIWENVPAYARGLEGGSKDPETVRRMFERDKDELRALGIPIETVTFTFEQGGEKSHGYRLADKNFHLPYLKLVREAGAEAGWTAPAAGGSTARGTPSPGPAKHFEIREAEAVAALDGLLDVASMPAFPLAREARSAFRKLAFDLDPELLRPTPTVVAEDPEAVATAGVVETLSDALLARKRVTLRYRSMARDDEAVRTVRPYGLLFQHGRWYLVAWAEDRDGVRMFRVGRMSDVNANTAKAGTPDYEIPEDFDLSAYAGRKAWVLGQGAGDPLKARVRFRFPRSLWAERNGHGTLVREDEDGSQLREIAVHRADPFLRWVLSLEGDARVEDPPELKSAFQAMVARVAERYGPDERGEGRRG